MKITYFALTTFLSGSVLAIAISFPIHAQPACDSIGMTQASRGTRCIKSLRIDTGKTMSSVSIPFDYSAPPGWIITNYQLVPNSSNRGNATVTDSGSRHLRGKASAQSYCKTYVLGQCVDRHGGWWNGRLMITLEKVQSVSPPQSTSWNNARQLFITEGDAGQWYGTWTRIGNSNSFNVIQKNTQTGQMIQFGADVYINGNEVTIIRPISKGQYDCSYRGNLNGNTAKGTYSCNGQGPFQWIGQSQ